MTPLHPPQPIMTDAQGIDRFQANALVRFLLDQYPPGLNGLALLQFSDADRVQLAQFVGYSVCGFSELPYVSDADWARCVPERVTPEATANPPDDATSKKNA